MGWRGACCRCLWLSLSLWFFSSWNSSSLILLRILMGDLGVLRLFCLVLSAQLSLSSILILCQTNKVDLQIVANLQHTARPLNEQRHRQQQIIFSKQPLFRFICYFIIRKSISTQCIRSLTDELYLMPLEQVFEGSISGYEVKIILNSEGIVFLLCNNHRRRYYQARIPYVLEGISKEIQQLFINLDEFFVYITTFAQDKDRVNITETGTILVTHMVHKTKKLIQMNPPRVRIQTEVLMTGMQIKNEFKLQNEITDVKRENLQLQNKINQLIKLNQNNQSQIEKLREMMNRKVERYRDSSASNSSSEEREQRAEKKKKKKKKFSVISDRKSGIVQLNTAIQELQKQVQGIKGVFEVPAVKKAKQKDHNFYVVKNVEASEAAIFGKKIDITVDRNNQYLQRHFRVQGNLITKINGYGRYQLLSKETIPLVGKHYFVMYIDRISYKLFSLGIVNQKNRNLQNSHKNRELISYFAKTGAIWEYGDCRCGGPTIPNRVELRIVVDMDKFTVKWFMDKKEIACAQIGQHLRCQRLVAYLQFNFEGDRVYWNQRTSEQQVQQN